MDLDRAMTVTVPLEPLVPAAEPAAPAAEPAGQPDALARSGQFWRLASPELRARIDAHNARIGRAWQRVLHYAVVVYLVGPILYLLIRLAFRIRVVGAEILDEVGRHGIFAFRHYYEWDPFISYFGAVWTRSLRRPYLHPSALTGHFWMKSAVRRGFSCVLGTLGIARGSGRGQSGLRRAVELLEEERPAFVGIAPTGPIGNSPRYEVKPGVGWLAADCPQTPVIPFTCVGLQGTRLGLSLFLRRPVVTIALGRPFRAADLDAPTDAARVLAVCARIEAEWRRLEGAPVS